MGGKKKQASRTKGNTRPSSSGRSADKLAASGTSLTGFLGFSTLQGESFIPATQGNDELDATIDAEFRLVMRKMSKKDTVTKLKAIQEFTAMCKERDASCVKSILPFWPRIFNRLSMDYERRIREAVFQALNVIVGSVQKNIAPHLRSIMGCWLLGQCDSYGPTTTAAKSAFCSAFPDAKQPDALVFCKTEILNLIDENLFQHTADTLIDADTLSADEKADKYIRTITSTLYAWKLFISVVPSQEHEDLIERYKNILGNDLFWKYHKNKSSLIRSAWFSLISMLLDNVPELMEKNAAKLASIIFNNLDESDPIVSPQVWEAAMKILTRIKDCWQYINVSKTLLPKLRHVLRNGGVGNANVIYPCMLLLLKEIPQDKVVLDSNFYEQFFADFRKGISNDKVKASSLELNAIVSAFMECFVYALIETTLDVNEREQLLLKQLMPLVESSIQDPNSKLSSTCLYHHLAQLLKKLHSEPNNTLSVLHRVFWENFKNFSESLNVIDADNGSSFKSLIDFYLNLRNPQHATAKEKIVRFQFVNPSEDSSRAKFLQDSSSNDAYFNDETNKLHDCLHAFLDGTLACALKCNSAERLKLLSLLCLTYTCPLLFRRLSEAFELRSSLENSALMFFENVIFGWIGGIATWDNDEFAQTAINFTLASYLSSCKRADKEEILNMIGRTEIPTLIECLIQTKFYGRDRDDVFALWLKGEQLSMVFVSMAKRLCLSVANGKSKLPSTECDAIWSILSFILSTDEKFDCMISSTCLGQILDLFHLVLPKPGTSIGHYSEKLEAGLEFICDLASRIFKNFQGCWQIQTTDELLLNFFFLACDPPFDISDHLLSKINGTLSCGIETLLATKGIDTTDDGLFRKGYLSIHKKIMNEKQLRHELVTGACLKLMECFKNYTDEEDWKNSFDSKSMLREFFNLVLLSTEDRENLRSKLGQQWMFKAFTREIMTVFNNKIEFSFTTSQLKNDLKYLKLVAFCARLICEALDSDACIEAEKTEFLKSELMQTWATEMLYAATFYDMIKDILNHESTQDGNSFQNDFEKYGNVIQESFLAIVTRKWNIEQIRMLAGSCFEVAFSSGNLWSVCLTYLFEVLATCDKQVKVPKLPKSEGTVSYIQTVQAFDKILLGFVDVENAVEMLRSTDDVVEKTRAMALLTRTLLTTESNPKTDELIPLVVDHMICWRDSEKDLFLFDSELERASNSVIHFNIEAQRLMKIIAEKFLLTLNQAHRDFFLCGLYSWIQTCFQGDVLKSKPYGAFLSRSSCLLLKHLSDQIMKLETKTESDHLNLVTEWNEFFSEAVFSVLSPTAVKTAAEKSNGHVGFLEKELLASMFVALETISLKCIESATLPEVPELTRHDKHNNHLPVKVQTLLNHLVPLLNSSLRSVQLGVFKVLKTLMPSLTKYEADLEQIEDEEQSVRELPYAFHSVLTETTAVVNSCIAEMQVLNVSSIDPKSSGYTHLMGYLLTWDLVLDLFSASSSELRSEYASYLQTSGLMHDLLANLFFLISEYSSQLDISRAPTDSPNKNLLTKTLFSQRPSLQILDEAASVDILHLACQVFFQAVKKLPVLVRQWWNNQDKTNSALIDKITSKYITPLLIGEEFHYIQHSEKNLESMMVRARLSAREVVATYMIDEVSMELIIKMSPNHPLGPVNVECGKRIGVGNTQWRNWMLQLNTFLIHQNGSILDGLGLWKRNVDKKFEGIEECYICFYILHGSNCQLPRQTCRTCKKKFHSACLYKWFYTSNQSTCPLCRNIFQ